MPQSNIKPFSFPDPKDRDPRNHAIQRALEILPGALTWATLIGMIILSAVFPVQVSLFVIAFDVYWILLAIFISTYTLKAFLRLRKGVKINWWERCQRIMRPEEYREDLKEKIARLRSVLRETHWYNFSHVWTIRKDLRSTKKHLTDVEKIIALKSPVLDWRSIIHVVAFPTAIEGPEIIEPAIRAVQESDFPNAQIIILLATEENEPEKTRLPKVTYLQKKFEGVFRDFIVTTHQVAPGEIKCKASNMTYAAKKLQSYLDEKKISYDRVIFSNFDCDTVCHTQYFSALTYFFCTDPNRVQRAYQPLPMYNNNLWDTNAFVRVIVLGSSFWHLFQSTRREMVTFSSHSESFETLVRVGFWPVNMISEDSIIYWKGFSYYHGEYEVKVIPLPVSLDAVLAETYIKTILNEYKQKRRWAYGIENFPVVMRALFSDPSISWRKRLRVFFEILQGNHSWATSSLILAFLGWLPLIFGGASFNESVIAHNLPIISGTLMTIAMFGLMLSVSLTFFLLPPKPKKYSYWRYGNMFLQWALIPFIAPIMGSLPAIDSQTRLMLGKYFGSFWVTEKVRKK